MFAPAAGWWDGYAALFLTNNLPILLAGLLFSAPVARWLGERTQSWKGGAALVRDAAYSLALMALLLVSASFLVKGTYNPFIYSNF